MIGQTFWTAAKRPKWKNVASELALGFKPDAVSVHIGKAVVIFGGKNVFKKCE